jgi:hypothetical protein
MRKVYNAYAEAFISLNSFDPITNAEEEDKYVCVHVCIADAVCRVARSLDFSVKLYSCCKYFNQYIHLRCKWSSLS